MQYFCLPYCSERRSFYGEFRPKNATLNFLHHVEFVLDRMRLAINCIDKMLHNAKCKIGLKKIVVFTPKAIYFAGSSIQKMQF